MVIKFKKYIEILGVDVIVKIYDDMEGVGKECKRQMKQQGTILEGKYLARGCVLYEDGECNFYILFAKNELTLELLTHECAHLTHAILKHHDMSKKHDTEMFSLLNGYLNSMIADKLKTKGIKIA